MKQAMLRCLACTSLLLAAVPAFAAGPSGHLELGYVPSADVAGTDADGVYASAQIAGPAPYSFFGAFSVSSLSLDVGPNDYDRRSIEAGYRAKLSSAVHLPVSLALDRYDFTASDVDATALKLGIDAELDKRAGLSVFVSHSLSAENQLNQGFDVNDFGGAVSLYFARQFGVFARYRQMRFNPDGAGANFDVSETIAGIKATF